MTEIKEKIKFGNTVTEAPKNKSSQKLGETKAASAQEGATQ